MQNYTAERFKLCADGFDNNVANVKSLMQEMLVIACFYAYKDGNTTPLNQCLDKAVNSKAISVERITRWVELHAGIARINKEQFVLNKKVREASVVTNDDDFAPIAKILDEVKWFDIKPKDVAKSVFDLEGYLEKVVKQIEKHAKDVNDESNATPEMFATAIKEVKVLKGKLAQLAIVETNEQDGE